MTDTPTTAQPISVRGHATPIIGEESFKILFTAACAALAAHMVTSQLALAAVLPAGGVLAMLVWGLIKRLETWRALKFLANYVGDDVATVSGPKQ